MDMIPGWASSAEQERACSHVQALAKSLNVVVEYNNLPATSSAALAEVNIPRWADGVVTLAIQVNIPDPSLGPWEYAAALHELGHAAQGYSEKGAWDWALRSLAFDTLPALFDVMHYSLNAYFPQDRVDVSPLVEAWACKGVETSTISKIQIEQSKRFQDHPALRAVKSHFADLVVQAESAEEFASYAEQTHSVLVYPRPFDARTETFK